MVSELQQADIFVLPTYYREGVPRVLLEAAACGVPIITTDMPGCKEVVIDGSTGILIQPKNVETLKKAIIDLLINDEKRKRMGEAGRYLAEKKFKKEIIIHEYLKIYRDNGVEI